MKEIDNVLALIQNQIELWQKIHSINQKQQQFLQTQSENLEEGMKYYQENEGLIQAILKDQDSLDQEIEQWINTKKQTEAKDYEKEHNAEYMEKYAAMNLKLKQLKEWQMQVMDQNIGMANDIMNWKNRVYELRRDFHEKKSAIGSYSANTSIYGDYEWNEKN